MSRFGLFNDNPYTHLMLSKSESRKSIETVFVTSQGAYECVGAHVGCFILI